MVDAMARRRQDTEKHSDVYNVSSHQFVTLKIFLSTRQCLGDEIGASFYHSWSLHPEMAVARLGPNISL